MLATAAWALLLPIPAAHSHASSVVWDAPTPADHSRFSVEVGSHLGITLTASTTTPGAIVHIEPARVPKGSSFNSSDGTAARATFSWEPEQAGVYTLRFTASTVSSAGGTTASAPARTYVIQVKAASGKSVRYPRSYTLATNKIAHWTVVLNRAPVRAKPRVSAPAFVSLARLTSDGTQNVVLVLEGKGVSETATWYRVRLSILPNNTTGWVQASDLGSLYTVRSHLYVDLAKQRATLKRGGRTIFTSILGVGKAKWPTPRGEFYIRSKLTNFNDPFYGPVAFGTSARSPTLTDWPGGGFVGVHGTNNPEILPGRVSHGCIRMPNKSILKLARLMPVGTPLTVR